MVLRKKRGLRELALFAGAGGGILGGLLLGWRTVAAVEIEEYPRAVLLQRQLDGILPSFPIWDDLRTFDGRPWRHEVDIITGGFPCQDISAAGLGKGLAGERSGLWAEMARVIGEVRPKYALVENSPLLTGRGLDWVLLDLAKMGYDARWCVLGAIDAGAPHKRDRIWILAHANEARWNGRPRGREKQTGRGQLVDSGCEMANSDGERFEKFNIAPKSDKTRQYPGGDAAGRRETWWAVEPELGRVANGVARRVDRLKAIGNGQVPAVVELAWETLSKF